MNQTTIIMLNMRGSCATDGNRVHALFRVNNRRSAAKALGEPGEPTGNLVQVSLAEPGPARRTPAHSDCAD